MRHPHLQVQLRAGTGGAGDRAAWWLLLQGARATGAPVCSLHPTCNAPHSTACCSRDWCSPRSERRAIPRKHHVRVCDVHPLAARPTSPPSVLQHYCLATNVIGSEARGTMRRAVQALKAGYETPVFPLLDRCRVALGARLDAELADRKGRIMQGILAKVAAGQAGAAVGPAIASQSAEQQAKQTDGQAQAALPGSGCPFSSASGGRASAVDDATGPAMHAQAGGSEFEAARQKLYSWQGVLPAWRAEVAADVAQQARQLGLAACPAGGPPAGHRPAQPLAFLDHAWGQLAPLAQVSRSPWPAPYDPECALQ